MTVDMQKIRRVPVEARRSLRLFLVGGESSTGRPVVLWVLAAAGALYLAYGASTYLAAKSALPGWLTWPAGVALGAPLVLAAARPLLAWRLAWVAAIATGAAVQLHHRTPFSWHPAVLAELTVILVAVALRHSAAVTVLALASMAALIVVSFYPADRATLIVMVTAVVAVPMLIHRWKGRLRSSSL